MDYNKWKRTPLEKERRRIKKRLVKYINKTPMWEIEIDKLNEIMGKD